MLSVHYKNMDGGEISKIVNDLVKKKNKVKGINKAKKKSLGY